MTRRRRYRATFASFVPTILFLVLAVTVVVFFREPIQAVLDDGRGDGTTRDGASTTSGSEQGATQGDGGSDVGDRAGPAADAPPSSADPAAEMAGLDARTASLGHVGNEPARRDAGGTATDDTPAPAPSSADGDELFERTATGLKRFGATSEATSTSGAGARSGPGHLLIDERRGEIPGVVGTAIEPDEGGAGIMDAAAESASGTAADSALTSTDSAASDSGSESTDTAGAGDGALATGDSPGRPPEPVDPFEALARAAELSPTDADALDALGTELVARDRVDEALEHVVRFAEAGGAPSVVSRWSRTVDPFRERRAAVLHAGAERLIDDADACFQRGLWLAGAAALDGAAAFLDAVSLECGLDPEVDERDDIAERTARLSDDLRSRRSRLHGNAEAVERLKDLGADLPEDATGETALQRLRSQRRDERASDAGEAHVEKSRHYVVTTTLGSRIAEQASAVLEATYEHCQRLYGNIDPLRGKPLDVEIVDSESALTSRRLDAQPPPAPWREAFLDSKGGRIVALDPREVGSPLDALWGRLAREASRSFLREFARGPAPLPSWLEEALATDLEGARLRDDGAVFDRRPVARLREVELSLTGAGPSRPHIDQVLTTSGHARDEIAWAWVLLRYLSDAVDEEGELMWSDRLRNLIGEYRRGTASEPLQLFRDVVVDGGRERHEVTDTRTFEKKWIAWILAQAAIDRGDEDAVKNALAAASSALQHRRYDEADALVRRVLAAVPNQPDGLGLRVDLARRRNQRDVAFLTARNLAAVRLPSGEWRLDGGSVVWGSALAFGPAGPKSAVRDDGDDTLDVNEANRTSSRASAELDEDARAARLMTARERFFDAIDTYEPVGRQLAEHDLDLRLALEGLVVDMLAEGYPRAALRVLDHALTVQPLDVGYQRMRETIVGRVLREHEVVVRRRVTAERATGKLIGDVSLWQSSVDASTVDVRCRDRVQPTTLRGLAELTPPYRVSAQIRFAQVEYRDHPDDGTNFAGFLLGARDAYDYGDWGLFITPAGRIELATRGRLEWPSHPIGRGRRGGMHLELRVEGELIEILTDGLTLGTQRLGSRRAPGWLALFVRHADVTFENLIVTRSRQRDPRTVWFTRVEE